jgi:hypothetical protein
MVQATNAKLFSGGLSIPSGVERHFIKESIGGEGAIPREHSAGRDERDQPGYPARLRRFGDGAAAR